MKIRGTWSLRLALVAGVLALAALFAPRAWIEPLLQGDAATASPDARPEVATDRTAIDPADFVFTDLQGEPMPLADALADGPVLVDFWATWCTPCKIAMPAYAALERAYADRGFELWAVSWDDDRMADRIAPYMEKNGFTFPALRDPDRKLGQSLGVRALPTSFLIAPDGTIVWQHTGFAQGDERELETVLVALLDELQGS